ncbi:hypothetical protein QFZ39_005104 [Paraburkholderia graminis]|nr:hypothetical protein [Paraburkholderia graminis]
MLRGLFTPHCCFPAVAALTEGCRIARKPFTGKALRKPLSATHTSTHIKKTRFYAVLQGPIPGFIASKDGSNPGFPSPRPTIRSKTKIIPETIDLMHPLVQDRDDADVAVGEMAPIDEMVFVTEKIALNAEFRRNGT